MLKNTYKSRITTVVGILILAAAVTSVFVVAGITWFDASIAIAIGLGLIFSPDDVLKRIKGLLKRS